MKEPVDLLVWFYNQRAGAENPIKKASNDAGLAAHPSGRSSRVCCPQMFNINYFSDPFAL